MIIISLEGLDKSGKATQSELLTKRLQQEGYNVVQSEFHRYDQPTGELIRKWLYKEWDVDQNTIELIITADKQAQQKWFEQLEQQGVDFLILDRYTTSQVAYSQASGIDINWTYQLQEYMRLPDLEIFIDIQPKASMERKGKHGENDRYESDLKLLNKVRDNYLEYYNHMDNVIYVDGHQTIEEIHNDIWEYINEKLNEEVFN